MLARGSSESTTTSRREQTEYDNGSRAGVKASTRSEEANEAVVAELLDSSFGEPPASSSKALRVARKVHPCRPSNRDCASSSDRTPDARARQACCRACCWAGESAVPSCRSVAGVHRQHATDGEKESRKGIDAGLTFHLSLGWFPPFDFPRPPPCGWSTAFIAVPRVTCEMQHVVRRLVHETRGEAAEKTEGDPSRHSVKKGRTGRKPSHLILPAFPRFVCW